MALVSDMTVGGLYAAKAGDGLRQACGETEQDENASAACRPAIPDAGQDGGRKQGLPNIRQSNPAKVDVKMKSGQISGAQNGHGAAKH